MTEIKYLEAQSQEDIEQKVELWKWENNNPNIFQTEYSQEGGLFLALITYRGCVFPVNLD
jgi:hypothetical protein